MAEVVGGLGVEKMNAVMPDIIRHSERTDIAPHVKDGYIMMFIYMPTVFPDDFTKYIGQVNVLCDFVSKSPTSQWGKNRNYVHLLLTLFRKIVGLS